MSAKRKYFGTDGIRGRVGQTPIQAEFVLKLGWAAGTVLGRAGAGKVLIGKDTRISGYMFESALEAGLSAAGIDIHLLGPMPTPAIAYLTRTLRAQAGIVISASHNPYDDNGIKFFSGDGMKLPDDLELAIEEQLDQPLITVDSAKLGKASRVVDAAGRYIEFCKSTVPSHANLKGMKIVVDCANGATYHVAPAVFRELGAEVIEINADPDGFNINKHCGSAHPEILQKIVIAEKADAGIAFDGDGDRVIMIDRCGEILDGDQIIFIIANSLMKQGNLRGGVVGTVMSNLGLELALREVGTDFVRTNVGDRYVIEELKKRHWVLGGEPSGHIICLTATTTGDGIIAALQALFACQYLQSDLHQLKAAIVKFPQTLLSIRVQKPVDLLQHADIQQAIQNAQSQLGSRGRVLLRPSGTEPVIRLMVEGDDKMMVDTIAKELAVIVQRISTLSC